MKNEVIEFYDNYTVRQERIGINKRHYSILKEVVKAGLLKTDIVLEMGCGNGTFSSLIVKYLKNGKLLSLDISPKSIEIAKKRLNKFNNIELIAADVTNYDFKNQKFDVIILPDVLEHIPEELHLNLFKNISCILKPKGFIFIHIPNPFYLEWCRNNTPELLQIIDQPVPTDILVKNISPNGLHIHEMKTYSIWIKDCDYQYFILRKNNYQNFETQITEKVSLIDKIKHKLNI